MISKKLAILLVTVALTAVACGGGDSETTDDGNGDADNGSDGATTLSVTASNFSFQPAVLPVEAGATATVELTNEDNVTHTFTSDDLGIDISADGGTSASGEITVPGEDGTIEFNCTIHPDMTGEVLVGAGGSEAGGSGGGGDTKDTDEGAQENDDGIDY